MIGNIVFALLVLMLSISTSCLEVHHFRKLAAGVYCTPPTIHRCYNDSQYGEICYCYTVSPQINPPSENKPQPPSPTVSKPNPPVEKRSPPPIVKPNPPVENKTPPSVTKLNPPFEKKSPPAAAPVVSKPNPPIEKKPLSPPVAKLNPPSPKKPEQPVTQQPKIPNRWDFCQISPRDLFLVKLRKQCWCSLQNSDTCFAEIWKASFYDSMEISENCCDAYWAVEKKCHGYMFERKYIFVGYKLEQLCSQYY